MSGAMVLWKEPDAPAASHGVEKYKLAAGVLDPAGEIRFK